MTGSRRTLLLVTPNFANNSLGRTYCLWLLAREVGWRPVVVGVQGRRLWEPLQEGPFADDCVNLTDADPATRDERMRQLVAQADVTIAVKPLRSSLGLAGPLARALQRPLAVDVDDPDLEVRSAVRPVLRRARPHTVWGRRAQVRQLRREMQGLPVLVSNPVLQSTYGGTVVPHVRPVLEPGPYSAGHSVVVRFVGSPRRHKGLEVLRAAVAQLEGNGVRLEVTAPRPVDARSWESWLGQTSLEEGLRLVSTADVIALPSLDEGYAGAQLPAKLMDAMCQGRPVVASDLAPIRWALGDAGLLVPPGDERALTGALQELLDPQRRHALGVLAYDRAAKMFTVPSAAPAFEQFLNQTRGMARSGQCIP